MATARPTAALASRLGCSASRRTLGYYLHQKTTILCHDSRGAGRQYATFRKSPSAPKPAPKRQDRVSLARIMLEDMVKIGDLTKDSIFTFSKDDYMRCLHVASKQVMSNSPRWLQAVPSGERLSAELLYETGILLHQLRWRPEAASAGMAMWAAASELNFTPATLSLIFHLMSADMYGKSPYFAPAEARFKTIVRGGRDPNALTLEARLLWDQRQYDGAAKVFERALQLGESGAAGAEGFPWKARALAGLGMAHRKLGNDEKALECCREASRLGLPDTDIHIGMLSTDADESQQHLFWAGCRNKDHFKYLAQLAMERSEAATDAEAKNEHLRWAAEWTNLADKSVAF